MPILLLCGGIGSFSLEKEKRVVCKEQSAPYNHLSARPLTDLLLYKRKVHEAGRKSPWPA